MSNRYFFLLLVSFELVYETRNPTDLEPKKCLGVVLTGRPRTTELNVVDALNVHIMRI